MEFYQPMLLMIAGVVIAASLLLFGGPALSRYLRRRENERRNKHNKP